METRLVVHDAPRLPGRLDRPTASPPAGDAAEAAGAVVLCGGEPTLLPDLPARIAAIRAAGADTVGVETDGLSLASPGVARALLAAGAAFVRVPFPSARVDAHDWLAGRPGTARARTRGIRAATRAGLAVQGEITLTRPTAAHAGETVAVLASLGVTAVLLRRLRVAGRVDRGTYLSLGARAAGLLSAARDASRAAATAGIELRLEGLDPTDEADQADHIAVFGGLELRRAAGDTSLPSPRLSLDPAVPSRELRRRMVRAARLHGEGASLRVAPGAFAHPAAVGLLRDAALLGVVAVDLGPADEVAVAALPSHVLDRLPPLVPASGAD